MAFTLTNFSGLETGDALEAAEFSAGASVTSSIPFGAVRSGTYCARLEAGTGGRFGLWETLVNGPASAGNNQGVGFGIRFENDSRFSSLQFFDAAQSGSEALSLRLRTDDEIELLDAGGSVVDTSTIANIAADTWYYIEVYWEEDAAGDAEVFLDGVSILSATGEDFIQTALDRYIWPAGPGDAGHFYVDDIYIASGLTAASDLLGPSEVFAYRSNVNAVTADAGDNLDVGTWLGAQGLPFDTVVNAEYTGTTGGSVNLSNVGGSAGTGGPKTDDNATGDIHGAKAIFRMQRSGGGASAHYILLGNDVDGTTRSPDLDPVQGTLTVHYFMSTDANVVPTSDEYLRLGFETDGNQDFETATMLGTILHTSSAAAADLITPGLLHSFAVQRAANY